jgi:hypothetical protein
LHFTGFISNTGIFLENAKGYRVCFLGNLVHYRMDLVHGPLSCTGNGVRVLLHDSLCSACSITSFCDERARGKSGGIREANRQRISVEDGRLEVSTTSNGGVCLVVVVVFPVGELQKLTEGGGRRCSVERMVLGTHFIVPGWCTADNHGMGSAGGACNSMVCPFDYRLLILLQNASIAMGGGPTLATGSLHIRMTTHLGYSL